MATSPVRRAVLLAALPCFVAFLTPHSVLLQNSADQGVRMPLEGLGMPCGPTYACKNSSYNATLSFLALGGRRTDSADSYSDAEPGIGLAMREWMAASPATNKRSDLFIGTKIGPGGACFPLGYNESIAQAKAIIDYYNSLPSSTHTTNITALDLLLIHWPVNCGPCAVQCPNTIPTTDPACDAKLPTYDERECRVSTWRGMVAVWKMGLTRSIGVSNFNSTNMQDFVDAGLPLPAVNQIEWNPGVLAPSRQFSPYPSNETFASLLDWCRDHNVVVNGYSPFGGHGQAGKTFSQPSIKAIAAAHNVSAAQAVLRWDLQLGVMVNPMSTNPKYQAENLNAFGFNLTAKEMVCLGALGSLAADSCPTPPPTPAQLKCEFAIANGTGNTSSHNMSLKSLPVGPFNLTDGLGDRYVVTSPCLDAVRGGVTLSPALEMMPPDGFLQLGFLSSLTTAPLPSGEKGLRLILSAGDSVACGPRSVWYDMVCDPQAPADQAPNSTMALDRASCTYKVEWRTPAACPKEQKLVSLLA